MRIIRSHLADCHLAEGLVVVIDVLRAFTTAGCLFNQGAEEIILAGSVDDALTIKTLLPDAFLLGEINGIKIPEFDLGNSPSALAGMDFRGKKIIQRTTAGTQGVVRAVNASQIAVAALTNITATVRYIQQTHQEKVTLIQTGCLDGDWGDEDVACGDMIEAKLIGLEINPAEIIRRVYESKSGLFYDGTRPDFPPDDLELATDIDRFSFAMLIDRVDGLNNLHCVHI